jgi:predicted amidohydrolase
VARAFENTCVVVFCNAGSPVGDEESTYLGLSQITAPFKGALCKLGKEEEMGIVDVDMGILNDAEDVYGVRRDIGGEGWHYGYSIVKD